jgi:hypothetical protein
MIYHIKRGFAVQGNLKLVLQRLFTISFFSKDYLDNDEPLNSRLLESLLFNHGHQTMFNDLNGVHSGMFANDYDSMIQHNPFWHAHHSQFFPGASHLNGDMYHRMKSHFHNGPYLYDNFGHQLGGLMQFHLGYLQYHALITFPPYSIAYMPAQNALQSQFLYPTSARPGFGMLSFVLFWLWSCMSIPNLHSLLLFI